jgi:hypothetical protein
MQLKPVNLPEDGSWMREVFLVNPLRIASGI